MIARGPLLSDDGREWVGDATLIELRDRAAVEAMLASTPSIRAGLYANVEVHDWEFGGRRLTSARQVAIRRRACSPCRFARHASN
jgi:hypothetical protein